MKTQNGYSSRHQCAKGQSPGVLDNAGAEVTVLYHMTMCALCLFLYNM